MAVTIKDITKQEAFLALYEPAHSRLARYCHAMVKNREDARDMISDTILTAYENFDKLRNPEVFLYFLFGIASRKIKQKLRRKKFIGILLMDHAENIQDSSSKPEEYADLSILFERLSHLPQIQRECIILFEISGFSLEEISELTKEKLSTVKSHLFRGRKKLQHFFRESSGINPIENTPFLKFKAAEINVLQPDKSTVQ